MSQDRVLRVLAIDDDSVSLKILARNLEQCGYKATTLTKATEALALLRANRDDFDVVLTDIMMPDMDGFQLLETIYSEIDVPVIMVSTETDPRKIVKGMKSGAKDYFVKPVQIEDLKKLPKYVIKRLGSSEKSHEDEFSEKYETESDQSDTPKRKHKKLRKRVNWTPELHDKFMNAVEQLEADDRSKVIPTKILEIMQEPSLTRENVASHLQKFRKGITKKRSSHLKESSSNAIPTSTADHSHAMTFTNIGQYNNFNGSGMMNSLNQIFSIPGSFYPANQNPLLFPPSNTIQQNCIRYPQMHPETISTPMLGNVCSTMLGNASTPMLESVLSAPTRNPERKGLRLPNTWQMPYGPEFAPYAQSQAFDASNQMQHRGVPTQMIMNSQVGSQLQQTHCSLSGQHDMQYKSCTVKADPNLIAQNRQISDFCYKEQAKLNEPIGEYPNRLEHQNSLDVFVDIASQFFTHPIPDCFDDNEVRLIN